MTSNGLTHKAKSLQDLLPTIVHSYKKMCHCKVTAFITSTIREEIWYIIQKCREHLLGKFLWRRLISHIIKRLNDTWVRQDASTKWGYGWVLFKSNTLPTYTFGSKFSCGCHRFQLQNHVQVEATFSCQWWQHNCWYLVQKVLQPQQPSIHL